MQDKWKLELLAWIATALIIILVCLPLYVVDIDFPFTWQNILIIVCFLTFGRYFMLFKFIPFISYTWIRVGFLLALPILFVFLLSINSDFNLFLQNQSLEELMINEHWNTQKSMSKYIRTEMIFFGTGSIIATILLGLRIVVSLWRTINNKGI
jgi:hypothetical protein